MCFTPFISLAAAVVEFFLASVLLLFFSRTRLRNFFAIFIIMLGFYQFTEFMLCTSFIGSASFWAVVGIITYSFLPAAGLHAVLRVFNRKWSLLWVYLVPVAVSIATISIPGFVVKAQCEKFFVNVATIMTLRESWIYIIPYYIYLIYYAGFIILSCLIIYKDYVKQKNPIRKKIGLVEIAGVVLMTVPTFILIIVLPPLGYMFPSILCDFAIFVAIAAFVGASLEGKLYEGTKKGKKVRKKG